MKIKNVLSLSITITLTICAIIITVFIIRNEFFQPNGQSEVRYIEDWAQVEFNGWQSGPDNARVRIIEFFDYECPYCKNVQPTVQAIQEKYNRQVSFTYVHNPLNGHSKATKAAIAAECARKQGYFKPFHDLLFTQQELIGTFSYTEIAKDVGVPELSMFENCLEKEETISIVQSGLKLAKKFKIDAIPSFIINGELISGALQQELFEIMIEKALVK